MKKLDNKIVNLELGEVFPSTLVFLEDGSLCEVIWRNKEGKIHRKNDLPAIINYADNNYVFALRWFNNDVLFRENDLPSRIYYSINMKTTQEEWVTGVEHHRLHGPAIVNYENDIIVSDRYLLDNRIIPSKKDWLKDPRVRSELKMNSRGLITTDISF